MRIIDIKNSIALVKHQDGRLEHTQTANLEPLEIQQYYRDKREETQRYFASKAQLSMSKG